MLKRKVLNSPQVTLYVRFTVIESAGSCYVTIPSTEYTVTVNTSIYCFLLI
jgi:hypothetical protein